MRVELHDHLTKPVAVPATRALITNDQGTPICLCVEMVPGHDRVFRVGDPDFNDQLKMHGVNRATLVKRIEPQKLVVPGG